MHYRRQIPPLCTTRKISRTTAMNTNDVIVDGRTVGRDPSAHVRGSLASEYYALQATGMEGGGIGDAGGVGGDAQ